MKARGIQFWTLLILSLIVSLLMIGEIFISRTIIKEQHTLVDSHETADTAPEYKEAWQKLAVNIWRGSAQDPALLDLLKGEGVGVHQGPPPGATLPGDTQPATNAAPSASTKPETVPHPATP